jgi:hypothetical protein
MSNEEEIAMDTESGDETSVQVDGTSAMDTDIGGKTFTPGTYRSGGGINFACENKTSPDFLFIAGSTLVIAADTYFILKNAAKAENVL